MKARTMREFEALLRTFRTPLVMVVVKRPNVVYTMLFGMN